MIAIMLVKGFGSFKHQYIQINTHWIIISILTFAELYWPKEWKQYPNPSWKIIPFIAMKFLFSIIISLIITEIKNNLFVFLESTLNARKNIWSSVSSSMRAYFNNSECLMKNARNWMNVITESPIHSFVDVNRICSFNGNRSCRGKSTG